MCNDNDIVKIKAKESVKLLTFLLIMIVVVGGVWEYEKAQAPLDNILVVYHRGEGVGKKIDNVVKTMKVENEGKKEIKAIEVADSVNASEDKVEENKNDVANKNAINEFLGTMDEVKNNLSKLEKPVLIFDKIVQVERVEEKKAVVNPFKDGEIEIFDSKKGVVEVEKVEVVDEKKDEKVKIENEVENEKIEIKNEMKDESLKDEVVDGQLIENKDEKVEVNENKNDNEAINMMEGIISSNNKGE